MLTGRRWWRPYYVLVTIARRIFGKPSAVSSARLRTGRRDRKRTTPIRFRTRSGLRTNGCRQHGEGTANAVSASRALGGGSYRKQNSTHRARRSFADTGKQYADTVDLWTIAREKYPDEETRKRRASEQLTIDIRGGGSRMTDGG